MKNLESLTRDKLITELYKFNDFRAVKAKVIELIEGLNKIKSFLLESLELLQSFFQSFTASSLRLNFGGETPKIPIERKMIESGIQ